MNSTWDCGLVSPNVPSLELLYQCTFPDTVARLDLLLRNAARTWSMPVSNVVADRWIYTNLVSYDEPYLFRFSQLFNNTGCNNTDSVLKDSSFGQRVCVGNISATIMFGRRPYFARGLWIGSSSNVSLASDIQILLTSTSVGNFTSPATGTITVPNNTTYVSFGSTPVPNLIAITLLPGAAGRIEISELSLDLFTELCPTRNAPSYGTMMCTSAPPESLDVSCDFGCNTGFQLKGTSSTQCRGANDAPTWVDPAPSCLPVSCPAFNETTRPLNGNFSCTSGSFGVFNYTSVCTFSCKPGFTLNHTQSLTCTTAGTWDHAAPTCDNINDCTSSSCPANATCFDGVQRTYCGLTVVPNSTVVVSGASVQAGVVQLDSVQGAVLMFNISLNDVTQAGVRTVYFGNSQFPVAYAGNCTVSPLGQATCTMPKAVGRYLHFQVAYEIRFNNGEVGEIGLPGAFQDPSNEFAYPIPRFTNKTLQFFGSSSSYSGNPLIGRTTLGEVIQFAGINFITPRFPQFVVYYGNPAGSRNYTCVADSSCTESSNYLCCKTQSNVQGTFLAFSAVILGELEISSADTYSYPVPARVTKVSGCTQSGAMTIDCPTSGTTITVEGLPTQIRETKQTKMQVLDFHRLPRSP